MKEKYYIVINNKFPVLAHKFIESIRAKHLQMPSIVVVRDGHREMFGNDVAVIDGITPFVYARNSNLGLNFDPSADIVLANDDLICVEEELFPRLHRLAILNEGIGIISPLIDGGVGNHLQKYPARWDKLGYAKDLPVFDSQSVVCFPCVYIKRTMINHIGGLDESFTGYGFDDDDYCIRAKLAGFRTCITPQLFIRHGCGGTDMKIGENWSLSFAHNPRQSNLQVFLKKYPQLAHNNKT